MLPSVLRRSWNWKRLCGLVRIKNDVFRIEGTKRLAEGFAPDKCVTGTHALESLKHAQWHLCTDFAVQSQNLQCSCHAVEQIPSAAEVDPRTLSYSIRFRNKLNRDDKLLLAFDARVLSEVLRREVGSARSCMGELCNPESEDSALAGEVRKLTDKIGTLLAVPHLPTWF